MAHPRARRDLGALCDALRSDLPTGVTLDVRRVGSPEQWQRIRRGLGIDIPYEQREALETAIRRGYYEYPREATLEDLAAELKLPLTTLRYRLRRAEAWAIAQQATHPTDAIGSERAEAGEIVAGLNED